MKVKKNIFYFIICIGISLMTVSLSYAAYTFSQVGSENKINTGIINFNYVENETALQVINPTSVSDNIAKISDDYFEFTVSSSATGKVDVGYYIYLTTDSSNDTSLNNIIKYYLTSVNGTTETVIVEPTYIANTTPFNVDSLAYSASSQNRLIYSSYYSFNNDSSLKSTTYRYRMWIDSSYFDNIYQTTENDGSHQISLTQVTYKVKINVLGVDGKPIEITN